MSWFGHRDRRPRSMDWSSSFVEAEVLDRSRGSWRKGATAYDAPGMAYHEADQERPIGSRRRDIAPPEAFGSAPPPEPRRPSVARRLASLMLLLAVLALVGGLAWVAFSVAGSGASGSDVKQGTRVRVVIPEGSNSTQIANILAAKGIVDNESVFRARLRLNGDGADFRSGSYVLPAGASYDTIVKVLEQGPPAAPTFDLRVIEGQRLEETAAHIDDLRREAQREGGTVLPAFTGDEYLAEVRKLRPPAELGAPKGTKSMEGLLFPATYQLKEDASAADFVARQREAMDEQLAQLDMARAEKANLTPYDIVIIASLIEREARLPKERPLVSAVIWNRLKVGEVLGIDASNQYSVYEPGSDEFWESELKQSQLELDSPYNLRKVAGLPPTPIAAPSAASLEAAAAPAKVDFRYYVANPDGSGEHFFTESYDEFLAHPFQGG